MSQKENEQEKLEKFHIKIMNMSFLGAFHYKQPILYDESLSQRITQNGIELIKEVENKIN